MNAHLLKSPSFVLTLGLLTAAAALTVDLSLPAIPAMADALDTSLSAQAAALGLPAPLLTGRSARVIITSDTPRSFLRLAYGDAILRQLKGQILGFCGFKPVKITFFAPASHPKPGAVDKLLSQMDRLGQAGR